MAGTGNRIAERGNTLVIGAMSMLWITPMVLFWGAAWGPLRPFDYPDQTTAPPGLAFFALLAACFSPLLLPERYYASGRGRRGTRLLETLGVRVFRRFATNGDLINRWARRSDPGRRTVRDRSSARAFLEETRRGERYHLILLLMGIGTAAYAVRLGWYGWAATLTAGNILFNLYPVLLQRYNRARLLRSRRRWLS